MSRPALSIAAIAGALAVTAALAQKPPPADAPQPLPTTKPSPLGAPTDPAPQGAIPAPQAAPPAPAIPAGEPAAVTRLRGLLGTGTTLSYGSVETTDAAGEAVRLRDVVLQQAGKRATIEELTLDGLRDDGIAEATLRNASIEDGAKTLSVARLQISGLTVPRQPGQDPDPMAITADAVRLERLRIRDDADVSIGSLSVEDWGAGRQARIALEALEVGMSPGSQVDRMTLARLVLRGIDLPSLIAALAADQTPVPSAGRQVLEIDDVALSAGGQPLGGVATVRMAGETDAQGSGTSSMAIRGLRVEPFPGLAEWLTRFGYQAIVTDLTAEGSFDAPTGRVDLTSFSLAGRDIGTLGMALVMDGLTPEAAATQDLQNIRLISMVLRYADQSLYRRFVQTQARQMRISEQQLREQYASMVGAALTEPGKAALDPIRAAVQSFIRGQAQEVEISIRPPEPVALSAFQSKPGGPAEVQRMLGLTATAR